jgi:hypothetical protein
MLTNKEDAPTPVAASRGDQAGARLVLFAALLALAIIGGFGLGRLTGGQPATGAPASVGDPAAHSDPPGTAPHTHDGTAAGATAPATQVGGLAVSTGGFTLVPERTTVRAGVAEQLRFRIDGRDGRPVTTFATVHDKPMHLVVVRRDLSGYQHLHPVLAPDGTWSVQLTLPSAGPWRAYADFAAIDAAGAQSPVTLGVDLVVAGDYAPKPVPAPATGTSVDGFTVNYQGTPKAGVTQPLLFRVTRDGAPAQLERYLGAYGHLVVLREGDLGYVHVHPEPELAGDAVKFWLAAPSPGRYRMFLDFQVAGAVHTAEFTVTLGAAG